MLAMHNTSQHNRKHVQGCLYLSTDGTSVPQSIFGAQFFG